jgi:hypothetical protein
MIAVSATIALPFRATRVMNRHARISCRKDEHHDERRSYHHRNRRRRCGTGRHRCADQASLEERRQTQEERAQGPETRQACQKTRRAEEGGQGHKKAAKPARDASAPRAESKGAKILELIGRPNGATLAEIMKATDWQAHSVRGFLSTAGKKRGLKIESEKNDAGERVYQIKK